MHVKHPYITNLSRGKKFCPQRKNICRNHLVQKGTNQASGTASSPTVLKTSALAGVGGEVSQTLNYLCTCERIVTILKQLSAQPYLNLIKAQHFYAHISDSLIQQNIFRLVLLYTNRTILLAIKHISKKV